MDYPTYVIRAVALYRDHLEEIKFSNASFHYIEKLVCVTADFDRGLKYSGLSFAERLALFSIPALEDAGQTQFEQHALEAYDSALRKMAHFMNLGRPLYVA